MKSNIETILIAAIHFDNGIKYTHQPKNIESGLILCGYRHSCIFEQTRMTAKERQALLIFEKEQGFLTNFNRFVDRHEAADIALASGQINEFKGELYSEDLW